MKKVEETKIEKSKNAIETVEEKILQLRVHQHVVFEGTHVSNFSDKLSAGKSKAIMTLRADLGGIIVESKKDRAFIPMVNIAYLKLDCPFLKKEREASSKLKTANS